MFPLLYLFLLIFPSLQFDKSKAIIIYFSRAGENYNVGKVDKGNTEMMVEYLIELTGIPIYKISPEKEYPINYEETLKVVQEEQSRNERPKIKNPLIDINKYDTILLGYPIWYEHLPNIVMNQLELLNLEGKIIYPFNTHEGSEMGNSINEIKKCAPKAIVKNGFAISGTSARTNDSHESIKNWIHRIVNEIDDEKIDYF